MSYELMNDLLFPALVDGIVRIEAGVCIFYPHKVSMPDAFLPM